MHLIVSHHLDAYCDQPQPWQFLVQYTCCSIDHFLSFHFVFLSSLPLPFLLEPSLFHHIFLLLFLFPFPFYYLSFHSMAYVVFLCTVLNMYLSFFPYPSFPSLSCPSLLFPSYILLASPFLFSFIQCISLSNSKYVPFLPYFPFFSHPTCTVCLSPLLLPSLLFSSPTPSSTESFKL